MFTDLQQREVFHLVFLQAFARSVPVASFVLKGGSNLRFFFGSIRYSEDMDLDIRGLAVHVLKERVMAVLTSPGLRDAMRTYGVERLQPPAVARAKQTETVQRFKLHLFTSAGEDLFTRIEFSRRGPGLEYRTEPVAGPVLAAYKLPPIIVPHYGAVAAARQKIEALVERRTPEARDVFDLYMLGSQPEIQGGAQMRNLTPRQRTAAIDRIYAIEFRQYRDTVVSFLAPEDQQTYGSSRVWDDIRLRVTSQLQEGIPHGGQA